MDIQTDMDSKRPNDQGRYLSKSAEQSSEPGCGLKIVTTFTLYPHWGLSCIYYVFYNMYFPFFTF